MMVWLCTVIVAQLCGVMVVLAAPVIPFNDTEARTFSGIEDAEIGTSEYLRHLYTGDDYLLIGGRTYLYNISSSTMELNKKHEWLNDGAEGSKCSESHYVAYDGDCYNYVMSADKKSDDLFVICAAAGVEPLCKLMKFENGEWTLTSTNADVSTYPEYQTTWFYAPPWHWTRRVIHKSSEGVDYGMSMRVDRGSLNGFYHFIRSATATRNGLLTPSTSELIASDPDNKKLAPKFSGMYDTEEHVYFLYSEPAVETFFSVDTVKAQYSRIGRVCKNDNGEREGSYMFTSFFKTRMLCGPKSETYGETVDKVKNYEGYYQTYIDVIEDNSQPHISSIEGADGEKIILALFSTPKGSLSGSAICAYKLSDIENNFSTNKVVNVTTPVAQQDPTKCVANSQNMTAAEKDIRKLHRLLNPVRAIDNDVMFFVEGMKMTRMVVDWQVEAADGKKYDIIFVATDDGRLVKLVKYNEKYHIVEEREIFYNQPIEELKMMIDESGKKHLVLSSYGDVKRVAIEKCHHYTSCDDCFALRDPYCGWSANLNRCVSTSHEADDKTTNIETGEDSICNVPTQYTTKASNEKSSIVTVAGENTESPTVLNPGASKSELKEGNTALIVGLVVFAIVLAGVAFMVGVLFGKKRYSSRTPHLDHELTNKNKDNDTLKSQNCSDYVLPPGKPSNLHYTNNLHSGNHIVGDNMGEATLQRQKKVYV